MPIKERRKNTTRDQAPARRRPQEGETTVIDMSDPEFLRRFVSEHGKILPPRLTGLNSKLQRKLKRGVRRARNMGTVL